MLRRGMSSSGRGLPAAALLPVLLLLLMAALSGPASAARWLCPDCPGTPVERAEGEPLRCPACDRTYEDADLIPPLGYINTRTRDAEVAWIVMPDADCQFYRHDGVLAIDAGEEVWVPWSLVEYFLPRMRLLRLTDGKELATNYAKDRDRCPTAPPFVCEVSDTLEMPGQPRRPITETVEETMAELFIVAFSPHARDSARARFIEEIEAGNHPRLPRTDPKLRSARAVRVPSTTDDVAGEAIVEVRVHESRGAIAVRLLHSAGNAELDGAALEAARLSVYGVAGELGVGVPAWIELHMRFDGQGGAELTASPAQNAFWRS